MGKFISFVKYKELLTTLEQLSERGFVWSNGSAAHIIPDVIRLVQSDVILIINPKMKCVDCKMYSFCGSHIRNDRSGSYK